MAKSGALGAMVLTPSGNDITGTRMVEFGAAYELEEFGALDRPGDGWLVLATGCATHYDDSTGCPRYGTFAFEVADDGSTREIGSVSGGETAAVSVAGFESETSVVLRFGVSKAPAGMQDAGTQQPGTYSESYGWYDLQSGKVTPIEWRAPDISFATVSTSPRSAATTPQRKSCSKGGVLYSLDGVPAAGGATRTLTVVPLSDPRDARTMPVALPNDVDLGGLFCDDAPTLRVLTGRRDPDVVSVYELSDAGVLSDERSNEFDGEIRQSTGQSTLLYVVDASSSSAPSPSSSGNRLFALVNGEWTNLPGTVDPGELFWISGDGKHLLVRDSTGYRSAVR